METTKTVTIICGPICSGKSTFLELQYPQVEHLRVDVGDVVRNILRADERLHMASLDVEIIKVLDRMIDYLKDHSGLNSAIIVGIRQPSILQAVIHKVNERQIDLKTVFLYAPEPVLRMRYEKRMAEKDRSISFEDAIKKDCSLGFLEVEDYLRSLKQTQIIANYSQNEIDSLQKIENR